MLKNQIIPKKCNERCVTATIINRAYYSSYLYCELWLKEIKNFKAKAPWKLGKNKKMGEHKQVRKALYRFGEEEVQQKLSNLAKLRKKADYEPFSDISLEELNEAIENMEEIFSQLKFQ